MRPSRVGSIVPNWDTVRSDFNGSQTGREDQSVITKSKNPPRSAPNPHSDAGSVGGLVGGDSTAISVP